MSPLALVDIYKSSVLGLLTAPLLLGDDCLQYKCKYNRLIIIKARRLRDKSAIRVMVYMSVFDFSNANTPCFTKTS